MTTADVASPLPSRMTRAQGEDLVARWRASGLSQSAFCRQQGYPEKRLWRWAAVLRHDPAPSAATNVGSAGFTTVVVGSGVRVRLASGVAIEVDVHFDAQLLRRVLDALC